MICAGIDAGSRTIKVVLYDTDKDEVVSSGVIDQGVKQESLAQELFDRLVREAGILHDKVRWIVATGYGRNLLGMADTTITEITCHARGVCHLVPEARSIIEIGGQDSKLICLDGGGAVRDFAMNDRCAAGTGRFLEVIATRLEVSLDEIARLAKRSCDPAAISNMCVVFAETEIVGLMASGADSADIVAGTLGSIAERIVTMAGRGLEEPVIFTGGVALIPGMEDALSKALGNPVRVVEEPLLTGALGAALLAAEM